MGTRMLSCFSCVSLRPHGLKPTRLLSSQNSPGKNTGELPCSPPGDLSDPEIEFTSLTSPTLAGGFSTNCATSEAPPPPPATSTHTHIKK